MIFKIQYTEYSREGALTNNIHADYFDNASSAEIRMNELNQQYYYDEQGEKTGIKCYKVELYVEAYKKIEDATAFWNQSKV